MRLFLAIELSDEVRRHLSRVADVLRSHVSRASFTRDQNLHITLKFLGETDERTLPELIDTLGHVRIGGEIELFADRIECFPNRGPVRIVAAGFGGELSGLEGLHRAVEQRCQRLGFTRENRAYRPHVTLARARPTLPGSIRAQVAQALKLPSPKLRVEEFVLMLSQLGQEGSRYQVLARFPLTPGP